MISFNLINFIIDISCISVLTHILVRSTLSLQGQASQKVNKSYVDFGYKKCEYMQVVVRTETGKAAKTNVSVAFLLRAL
jgi:hypothetical protein